MTLDTSHWSLVTDHCSLLADSSLRQFQAIFNDALDAILIADDAGNYIDANPAACKLLGLPRDELLGCNISHFAEPGLDFAEAWRGFLAQGRITGEFRLLRPDGTVRETEFAATANILPHRHLSVLRDVTQRKQAEAALAEKQQFIEQISESISAILFIYDAIEQRNIYCNRQIAEILGYSSPAVQALGAMLLPTLLHPDDSAKLAARMERFATAKDGEIVETEYRMRRADGKWCWLYSRDTVFTRTASGQPQQILGVATDITHLKQVEEELRQSEEQLRLALEASRMGMWDWNILTNRITWSRGHEALFGLSPGAFDGSYAAFEECIHPEDRAAVAQSVNRARLGQQEYHQEFRVLWSDGSIHWIEGKGKVFYNSQGQAVRMLGTILDISDRKFTEAQILALNAQLEQRVLKRTEELRRTNEELKQEIHEREQAEAALRLQAQRERLVTGIAHYIRQSLNLDEILNTTVTQIRQFLECDRVLIYRTWSDGAGSVITEALAPGCPAIIGRPLPERIFPQECRQWYYQGRIRTVTDVEQDDMAPCLANWLRQLGVKSKLVVPIVGQDSLWGLLIAHQCGTPRRWQVWEIELLSSLATQIAIAIQQAELYSQLAAELAERKQIQQQRDRFFNLSLDMLMIASLDGYCLHANPAWERTLGFTSQELTAYPFIEFVHPADRAATQAALANLAAGIPIYSFENRYCCQDGSYKWLCWNAVPFLEERLVYAVARDVTDRKLAEQALQESEERFRATFEQAAVGICHCSLDERFFLFNQKFCDIIGYTPEETQALSHLDITHPDDLDIESDYIQQILSGTWSSYSLEKRYICKDGSIVWVNVTGSLVRSATGEIKYGVAVVEDISERKQIEEELRESQLKYQTLFQIFPIGISITDRQGNLIEVNSASESILGVSREEQT
ncbi:MAG TPA: PAS domain S-box protein, partial [Allocoleopsis sp.]